MTRTDLLRHTQLFAGCTEQDLISLAGIARDLDFEDGEVVFAQGDQAQVLMVVSDGCIQLELPVSILGGTKNVAFETKGRGDVVGWSALVSPHRFSFSARASGRTSVVAFPREDMMSLLDGDPEIGFRVMRNLAAIVGQRFHHTQKMWACEIQRSLDERYR